MKLKDEFITQEYDGEQIMVATGVSRFNGLVRSNATAAFIVNCLKNETTKDKIVDEVFEKYDAERNVIEKSVEDVIEKLRKIGALDE